MCNARFFCPILTYFGIFRQMFISVPRIKFHGNPSSRSRADTRGHMDGRTDTTKLKGDFREYANALQELHVCRIAIGTVWQRWCRVTQCLFIIMVECPVVNMTGWTLAMPSDLRSTPDCSSLIHSEAWHSCSQNTVIQATRISTLVSIPCLFKKNIKWTYNVEAVSVHVSFLRSQWAGICTIIYNTNMTVACIGWMHVKTVHIDYKTN